MAVEKNVEAFLELDLPGSKWVVGTGPALERIRERFPKVNYLGVLEREELAKVYAAADVFVFPSKTDTFGLVLLEAMACGLPVAAYPVTGPRDVIGDSKAGVLHEDLRTACLEALKLNREDALARARLFTWRAATEQFFGHLHPRKRDVPVASLRVIPKSNKQLRQCTVPVPAAAALDLRCVPGSACGMASGLSLYSRREQAADPPLLPESRRRKQLGRHWRAHGELRMNNESSSGHRAASATSRSAPTISRIAA